MKRQNNAVTSASRTRLRGLPFGLLISALFCLVGLPAYGQIDGAQFAADVRSRFGPPLARQTFLIPAGEMVVDYAANTNICTIQLPAMGPDDRQPGVSSAKALDTFLLDLVPLTLRGKELRRMVTTSGLHSISTIEYENIVVAEGLLGTERTGVTVTFTNEKCQDRPAQ